MLISTMMAVGASSDLGSILFEGGDFAQVPETAVQRFYQGIILSMPMGLTPIPVLDELMRPLILAYLDLGYHHRGNPQGVVERPGSALESFFSASVLAAAGRYAFRQLCLYLALEGGGRVATLPHLFRGMMVLILNETIQRAIDPSMGYDDMDT